MENDGELWISIIDNMLSIKMLPRCYHINWIFDQAPTSHTMRHCVGSLTSSCQRPRLQHISWCLMMTISTVGGTAAWSAGLLTDRAVCCVCQLLWTLKVVCPWVVSEQCLLI